MIETAACQGAGTDADIQIVFTDSTGKIAGPLRIREVDGDCFELGVFSKFSVSFESTNLFSHVHPWRKCYQRNLIFVELREELQDLAKIQFYYVSTWFYVKVATQNKGILPYFASY